MIYLRIFHSTFVIKRKNKLLFKWIFIFRFHKICWKNKKKLKFITQENKNIFHHNPI